MPAATRQLVAATLIVAICHKAESAVPVSPRCQAERVCVNLAAPQLFDLADRLIAVGRISDAEATLRGLAGDRDAEVRAEARYRLGNLLRDQGDMVGAATAYRALLDEKPDATPVRLALASVLASTGQEEAASAQLRRASSAGLPEDVAQVVDKFQLALRSRRRVGGSIEFGLAPDSNINRSTSNQSVTIGSTPFMLSRDARARSGLGLTSSSQAFWRPALNADTNLLLTASASADLYRQSGFDDIVAELGAGPELLRGRTRLRPAAVVNRRWFGGKRYSDSYGTTVNWLRQLGRASQMQLDLTALHTKFKRNPAMTGGTFGVVGRYDHAFTPRFVGRLTVRAIRQSAREPAFASWSAETELLFVRDIGHYNLFAGVGIGRTWGDAPFNLPPARRRDRLIHLEGGLVMHGLSFHGFAPLIQIHYTQNRSPVFLYNYRRTRIEFGLTREF